MSDEVKCPTCKTPVKPTQDGLLPKHKLPVGYSRHEHRKRKRVFCTTSGSAIKLRELLPKGGLATLIYDDCEPEPITGHRITELNGPQVQIGGRWYYLYQVRGGRDLLAQWRLADALQPVEKEGEWPIKT